METLEQFLESWEDCAAKEAFGILREALAAVPGVVLSTKLRPGVSISLRGGHPRQEGRELFVMVDIIGDGPGNRWLWGCFFADLGSDPGGRGDFVPQGRMGGDGRAWGLDEGGVGFVGFAERGGR